MAEAQVVVGKKILKINQSYTEVERESKAIIYSSLSFIISFIVMYLILTYSSLKLKTVSEFGPVAALCVAIVAITIFLIGFRHSPLAKNEKIQQLSLLTRSITTFAFGCAYSGIAFLMTISTYVVSADYLHLSTIKPHLMALLLGLALALTTYIVFIHATRASINQLASILTIFTISGAFASMFTAQNSSWWQHHFSALGAGDSWSSYAFNITMVISGLIAASFAPYITREYIVLKYHYKSARFIQSLFIVIGICLIIVGLFPYDTYLVIHNIAANLMSITFGVLMISLPWTMPRLPKLFIVFSYSIIIVIVLAYFVAYNRAVNLLELELIACSAVFVWLVLFARFMNAVTHDNRKMVQ